MRSVDQSTGRLLGAFIGSRGQMPMPVDQPRVHAMGPDPDRILTIGGGAVSGVGVTSHEVGLGGHLARRLSSLTGRGADVELIGLPGLSIAQCEKLVAEADLARYDALVISIGGRDALALSSAHTWKRRMTHLVRTITEIAPSSLSVFIVGLPPVPSLVPIGGRFAETVARQVKLLNEASSAACAGACVTFIDFDPTDPHSLAPTGNAQIYAAWAETIATKMFPVLEAAAAMPHDEVLTDEEYRQQSLDVLRILDSGRDPEVDAVTRVAKDLFGVDVATLNFIDHDRQWTKSVMGMDELPDMPRSESFCSVTIERPGLTVVADAAHDPRFASFPSVLEGTVRFYAGYPIEAPNGQRVGTLCLADGRPRPFSKADESLLRELALRVQSHIWERARSLSRT